MRALNVNGFTFWWNIGFNIPYQGCRPLCRGGPARRRWRNRRAGPGSFSDPEACLVVYTVGGQGGGKLYTPLPGSKTERV